MRHAPLPACAWTPLPASWPLPQAQLDAAAAAATAAFHVCPNLRLLAAAMLAHPPDRWEEACPLAPGVPIKPMLAKICEGLPDAARQLRGAPFLGAPRAPRCSASLLAAARAGLHDTAPAGRARLRLPAVLCQV